MKLEWNAEQIKLDGKMLKKFDYPIRGVLEHKGVIIVLLDGPKASENTHPELVEEMNRNVYGLDYNGNIKWRIASHGSGKLGSTFSENPFLYLAIWNDTFVFYNGYGPYNTLNVKTGDTEYLSPEHRDALLAEAKRSNRQLSSPDTRGPAFA